MMFLPPRGGALCRGVPHGFVAYRLFEVSAHEVSSIYTKYITGIPPPLQDAGRAFYKLFKSKLEEEGVYHE